MAILFVDTTYDITLGILDDDLRWLDFERFQGQKASSVIQAETHSMLSAHKLKAGELKAVISVAGPGFYTGLRLSEGMSDVFKFFGVDHYSFFTYDIPKWCGHESGIWFTKAYRGEYFVHRWDTNTEENILIDSKNLSEFLSPLPSIFIHSTSALDENSLGLMPPHQETHELLRQQSPQIFSEVLKTHSKKDSFYFRAPEDEFKVST